MLRIIFVDVDDDWVQVRAVRDFGRFRIKIFQDGIVTICVWKQIAKSESVTL